MALVVLTGGARSGKSGLAQELARNRALDGARVVVAVFGDAEADAEMAARVEQHRRDRPAEFQVVEAHDSTSWLGSVGGEGLLLLDCLGTLVSRVLDELTDGDDDDVSRSLADHVESRVNQVIDTLLARPGDTIVVTNEVGEGVVPPYASGRLFRDVLGRANRRLVQASDAAYLVVCGRVLDLKNKATSVRWPTD